MKPWGVFATAVVALLSGFASGYALAHYQLTRDFEDRVDTEVEEMREYMLAKYGDNDMSEESQDSEEEVSTDSHNPIEAELADLKKQRSERKIGESPLKDHKPYYRFHSDGVPDTGEEGEHVDMSEEDTPTKRVKKSVSNGSYEVVQGNDFNGHGYDTTLHFTYYYDEDLLLDFWRNQIEDNDRRMYVGDVEFERPAEHEDETDIYILNHVDKLAIHVNITVFPIPDDVYDLHEEYIKNRFSERHSETGGE